MAFSPFPSSCAFMASKSPPTQSHSPSLNFPSSFKSKNPVKIPQLRRRVTSQRTVFAMRPDFDMSFFARDILGGYAPPEFPGAEFPEEDDEGPQCPPGLRKYETMVVLRPDMSEDERLAFTQKYEELLVAGGGMYVDVYNKGVVPLSYSIRTRDRFHGKASTYWDGIFLLFTYFTRPESMAILTETLLLDDDVIRSSSFKTRKRRYKKRRSDETLSESTSDETLSESTSDEPLSESTSSYL